MLCAANKCTRLSRKAAACRYTHSSPTWSSCRDAESGFGLQPTGLGPWSHTYSRTHTHIRVHTHKHAINNKSWGDRTRSKQENPCLFVCRRGETAAVLAWVECRLHRMGFTPAPACEDSVDACPAACMQTCAFTQLHHTYNAKGRMCLKGLLSCCWQRTQHRQRGCCSKQPNLMRWRWQHTYDTLSGVCSTRMLRSRSNNTEPHEIT